MCPYLQFLLFLLLLLLVLVVLDNLVVQILQERDNLNAFVYSAVHSGPITSRARYTSQGSHPTRLIRDPHKLKTDFFRPVLYFIFVLNIFIFIITIF
jgi:hypothetical protein